MFLWDAFDGIDMSVDNNDDTIVRRTEQRNCTTQDSSIPVRGTREAIYMQEPYDSWSGQTKTSWNAEESRSKNSDIHMQSGVNSEDLDPTLPVSRLFDNAQGAFATMHKFFQNINTDTTRGNNMVSTRRLRRYNRAHPSRSCSPHSSGLSMSPAPTQVPTSLYKFHKMSTLSSSESSSEHELCHKVHHNVNCTVIDPATPQLLPVFIRIHDTSINEVNDSSHYLYTGVESSAASSLDDTPRIELINGRTRIRQLSGDSSPFGFNTCSNSTTEFKGPPIVLPDDETVKVTPSRLRISPLRDVKNNIRVSKMPDTSIDGSCGRETHNYGSDRGNQSNVPSSDTTPLGSDCGTNVNGVRNFISDQSVFRYIDKSINVPRRSSIGSLSGSASTSLSPSNNGLYSVHTTGGRLHSSTEGSIATNSPESASKRLIPIERYIYGDSENVSIASEMAHSDNRMKYPTPKNRSIDRDAIPYQYTPSDTSCAQSSIPPTMQQFNNHGRDCQHNDVTSDSIGIRRPFIEALDDSSKDAMQLSSIYSDTLDTAICNESSRERLDPPVNNATHARQRDLIIDPTYNTNNPKTPPNEAHTSSLPRDTPRGRITKETTRNKGARSSNSIYRMSVTSASVKSTSPKSASSTSIKTKTSKFEDIKPLAPLKLFLDQSDSVSMKFKYEIDKEACKQLEEVGVQNVSEFLHAISKGSSDTVLNGLVLYAAIPANNGKPDIENFKVSLIDMKISDTIILPAITQKSRPDIDIQYHVYLYCRAVPAKYADSSSSYAVITKTYQPLSKSWFLQSLPSLSTGITLTFKRWKECVGRKFITAPNLSTVLENIATVNDQSGVSSSVSIRTEDSSKHMNSHSKVPTKPALGLMTMQSMYYEGLKPSNRRLARDTKRTDARLRLKEELQGLDTSVRHVKACKMEKRIMRNERLVDTRGVSDNTAYETPYQRVNQTNDTAGILESRNERGSTVSSDFNSYVDTRGSSEFGSALGLQFKDKLGRSKEDRTRSLNMSNQLDTIQLADTMDMKMKSNDKNKTKNSDYGTVDLMDTTMSSHATNTEKYVLYIKTNKEHRQRCKFKPSTDLNICAQKCITSLGIKEIFKPGLLNVLKEMRDNAIVSKTVDIVDLL